MWLNVWVQNKCWSHPQLFYSYCLWMCLAMNQPTCQSNIITVCHFVVYQFANQYFANEEIVHVILKINPFWPLPWQMVHYLYTNVCFWHSPLHELTLLCGVRYSNAYHYQRMFNTYHDICFLCSSFGGVVWSRLRPCDQC